MKKNRDLKVELLRIISILLVITNHSILSLYNSNPHIYLPLNSVSLMGVTIFFIISGFYLYNKHNTAFKVYKNYLLKIFIPFVVFCIIVIMFEKTITCEESFISNLSHINLFEAIKVFFIGIRQWTCINWIYLLGHTWYVFDYSIIILLFPITHFVLNKFDKRFVYILCIMFLLFIIYIDFTVPKGLGKYILSQKFQKPVFLNICGYIYFNDLYKKLNYKLDSIKKYKLCIKSIICFLFLLISIFCLYFTVRLQMYYNTIKTDVYFPYYFRHESFFMIMMSFAFISFYFILVDIINVLLKNNSKSLNIKNFISKIILFLSKNTFLVYLIHSELLVFIMNKGLLNYIISSNPYLQILYSIIFVFIIYLLSVLLTYIINPITYKNIYLKKKKIKNN